MKNSIFNAKLLTVFLMILLGTQPTTAQSQNPQALTWFDAGLSKKEPHSTSIKALAELQEGQNSTGVKPDPFTEKLENEYADGMAALKAHNWARAILAFGNVLEIDRHFREAQKRLKEAQNGLERESTEMIVARYYAEGITAMNKNDFGGALALFEEVRKLNSNYRDVASLVAEVDSALQKRPALAPSPAMPLRAAPLGVTPATLQVNVDSLYRLAVTAFDQKEWLQAVINFEKVHLLQPDYRDAVDRLAQARANLALASQTGSGQQLATSSNLSSYIGGLLALFVLPLLSLAVFSPATRARLHLVRGNYLAAAQLYEKKLARHPNKVKLYPALANIYLLLGRHDENALKVYKMVLQLNLATRHRDEINTIVAQNYLTEGRTDSDAIEVLENALKAEQRRYQQQS